MKPKRKRIPYKQKELFGSSGVRRFSGNQLDEIAFPLGGIGAGCVSLGGWGQLRDWEIFNHPDKGLNSSTTFFALRCTEKRSRTHTLRLLQGPPGGSYVGGGHGLTAWNAKLPAFRACEFEARFPFAQVFLRDRSVPVNASIEAFSPFIPLDDWNSSLPLAIFRFRFQNRAIRPVRIQLFALLENLLGHPERGRCRNTAQPLPNGGCALVCRTLRHPPGSPRFGSLVLATPFADSAASARVLRDTGFDGAWEFWRALETQGTFPIQEEAAESPVDQTLTGGLRLEFSLQPQAAIEIPIVLAWHSPVSEQGGKPWNTFVATMFKDALEAAEYAVENLDALTNRSRRFSETLFDSTLPGPALEALSSQLAILKSPTCLRFEDGRFWGWEGCSNTSGCCPGTCTHVWNYAQALAWLFPALERSVREQHFALNMDPESGRMCFRQPLPPGTQCNIAGFHAAADGQLGGVMKVYREWMICGDDDWLRSIWPACRKSLEFAWKYWDYNRDGVVEGVMHNTYDNEFWGPNSMIQTFYLGALKAAAEIARYLGETQRAEQYAQLFERGRAWTEEHLFNGRWYHQIIDPEAGPHTPFPSNHLREGEKLPRYQYGEGCLSDQLIGEWYAQMLDLGPLLDPERVRTALKNIFRYNWKPQLTQHACLLRAYAVNREAGLVLCTWPGVPEPPYPFWFSSEVWCGIEYQVAAHMIMSGLLARGLAIVKAVRDRHDGRRRNPYDEFECGHHYSRSLASYALLHALAGFHWHAPKRRIRFEPKHQPDNFRTFFCTGAAWGRFQQDRNRTGRTCRLTVEEGELRIRDLELAWEEFSPKTVRADLDNVPAPVTPSRVGARLRLRFEPELRLGPGAALSVCLPAPDRKGS